MHIPGIHQILKRTLVEDTSSLVNLWIPNQSSVLIHQYVQQVREMAPFFQMETYAALERSQADKSRVRPLPLTEEVPHLLDQLPGIIQLGEKTGEPHSMMVGFGLQLTRTNHSTEAAGMNQNFRLSVLSSRPLFLALMLTVVK